MTPEDRTTCCIAGCGPAGAMLGLLLARAGVDVVVLEKHGDFLRDFRGDTVHPSTVRLFRELGLEAAFLALPHRTSPTVSVMTDDGTFTVSDFRRLRHWPPYLIFMPQWDLLDFVTGEARRAPNFDLRMHAEVESVLRERRRVVGVRYRDRDGRPRAVCADLVVAADGRNSAVCRSAGMRPVRHGAPMDVLWFRVSRGGEDPANAFGRLAAGHVLVLIDRGDYWQAGYLIPSGGYDALRGDGLDAFRTEVGHLAPFLAGRMGEVASWDDISLLRVQVNRLRRWWRPGLLVIGDAAHAMSPIGGVGINLAVQDAVAAANLLAEPLLRRRLGAAHLLRVQLRRSPPATLVQWAQRGIQRRFLAPVLAGRAGGGTPRLLRLLNRVPALQALPARLVGVGPLPEHVRVRAVRQSANGGESGSSPSLPRR